MLWGTKSVPPKAFFFHVLKNNQECSRMQNIKCKVDPVHSTILIREAKRLIDRGRDDSGQWVLLPCFLYRDINGMKVPRFEYKYSKLNIDDYSFDFFLERARVLIEKYDSFNTIVVVLKHIDICIVDCDKPEAIATVQSLCHGIDLSYARTPRGTGGRHYYFNTKETIPTTENDALGIDIPHIGFWPPSKIQELNGTHMYNWGGSKTIIHLPDSLRGFLLNFKPKPKKYDGKKFVASESYIKRLMNYVADKGNRHAHMRALAIALHSVNQPEDNTRKVLTDLCKRYGWWDKRCKIDGIIYWVYHQMNQK